MSDDPRDQFVKALRRALRCGPVRRRRVMREVRAHLDDTVTELEASGMDETEAVQEALRRLGEVATITSAFREARTRRRGAPRGRSLRSPAWVAVGAMSLVTALAAELPQASGAKANAPSVHAHRTASRLGHARKQHDVRVSLADVRHPGRR